MDETRSQSARLERRGPGAREPREPPSHGSDGQGARPRGSGSRRRGAGLHCGTGARQRGPGGRAECCWGLLTPTRHPARHASGGVLRPTRRLAPGRRSRRTPRPLRTGLPRPSTVGPRPGGPSDFLGNGHNGKWMQCARTTLYDVMAGLTINTARRRRRV